MRLRIGVSVAIGVASGLFCTYLLRHFHQGAADFGWAIRLAQNLLAGRNPYDTPLEQYPLIAVLFAWPFARVSPEIAGGAFYGISSALLAFGLTRNGYHRLWVFLAYPYWAGLIAAQWSALIFASAFFPLLLPAALAKPQVGLPVALTRLTRRGVLACLAAGLLSLVLMPRWPWLWLTQAKHYDYFIPALVFPGALLLFALLRYRERDAWLLLLAAIMPQRWFFDAFTLWLIPKSRREILFTAAVSWGAGVWRWFYLPQSFTQVGRFSVAFIYLPMLAVVLLRPPGPAESSATAAGPQRSR